MANVPTVFVSATTKGLCSYREAVRDELLKLIPPRMPTEQQDFAQMDDAVLIHDKLIRLIEPCDAVICLIGPAYGGEPRSPLPGAPRQSYTQMEYQVAKALGKPVFVLLPDASAQLDDLGSESSDVLKLQQEFLNERTQSNRDWQSFRDHGHLRDIIHRLALPVPHSHQPVHNLPDSTLGTLFKGREPFLRDLKETLTGGLKRAASIVQGQRPQGRQAAVIHALGGTGKTRAAVEYAWQHQTEYDALLFVSAPTVEQLETNIAALIGPLHIKEAIASKQEEQFAKALQWLQEHPRWFLILDNVDSDEAVAAVTKLLARLSRGHVVITSRIANWPGTVQPLDLSVLTREAAVALLLDRTQGNRVPADDDEEQAGIIAQQLDGLPLALSQAGAYISKLRLSFSEYLTRLKTNAVRVHQWHDETLVGYPKSLATAWFTTTEKLAPQEKDLLQVLAWFDAEPIPVWLLEKAEGAFSRLLEGKEKGQDTSAWFDMRETLAGLAEWHLVTYSEDGRGIRLHRLVQEVTLEHLKDPVERSTALDQALQWLHDADLGDPEEFITWSRWEQVQPHALRLAHHAEQEKKWEPAVRWPNEVAVMLRLKALHAQAETLLNEARKILGDHLSADHELASEVFHNSAELLRATYRQKEAEVLYRRAISIGEMKHGTESPRVAKVLNKFAMLLRVTNRVEEAEAMCRRALAIYEKSYQPEHPKLAVILNDLGVLLDEAGRKEEAEPLYRRALAIMEKNFGPDDPEVAIRLHNLAMMLGETNRRTEAEPLARRSLAIYEKSYGLEHPRVAMSLNNLASLLEETDQQREAEPMYRRALAIDEKAYGSEHPAVTTDLNLLGMFLSKTGRVVEAEGLYRRALDIHEKSGEREHRSVAAHMMNLAVLLHSQGRDEEALSLYKQAMAIHERSNQPNSP